MDTININSAEDLRNYLKKIDITVPERTKGRKTKDTEEYAIIVFIATQFREGKLKFPLSLVHRDKPDFLLQIQDRNIGIECTEAIPEQMAWALALWEENYPDGIFEPEFFGWNSLFRSRKEILEILAKSQIELYGDPCFGRSVEKEWALGMNECVIAKQNKLNMSGFDIFPENYLLIYDNLLGVANDLNESTTLLFEKIKNKFEKINTSFFTKIFIVSNCNLISINSSNFQRLEIPSLEF